MTRDSASRRVHERYDLELPVVIIHGETQQTGQTSNLSLGGMFIVMEDPPQYGTPAKIRLRLPAMKDETEVPVVVRWVTPEGIGVQFGSLRAIEVWALNQLFKKD